MPCSETDSAVCHNLFKTSTKFCSLLKLWFSFLFCRIQELGLHADHPSFPLKPTGIRDVSLFSFNPSRSSRTRYSLHTSVYSSPSPPDFVCLSAIACLLYLATIEHQSSSFRSQMDLRICFDKPTDLSCISIKTDAFKKLLKLFWNYKQTLQTLQVVHVVCANIKRWKTTTQFVFISNSVQLHPYQLIGFVSLGGNSSRFFRSKAVSSVLCHSVLWRFDSCCLQKTQLAIRRQVETTLIQSFWESILLRLTILGSYIDLRHSFA